MLQIIKVLQKKLTIAIQVSMVMGIIYESIYVKFTNQIFCKKVMV